jgi:hypothetical protein
MGRVMSDGTPKIIMAAILLGVVGGLALVLSFGGGSASTWLAGGSCLGTALMLYLIAQLVFIRANTEK